MKNKLIKIRNELTEIKDKISSEISKDLSDKKKIHNIALAVNYLLGSIRNLDSTIFYLNKLEEKNV